MKLREHFTALMGKNCPTAAAANIGTSRHSISLGVDDLNDRDEVQNTHDQDLFRVTFIDLQLIKNSMGSIEVNAKEFAASSSS